MEDFNAFLASVVAGIVANIICKWLDRSDNSSQHKD